LHNLSETFIILYIALYVDRVENLAKGRNLAIRQSTSINPHLVNEVELVDAWARSLASPQSIANSPARSRAS
jgi:hypothetical protein